MGKKKKRRPAPRTAKSRQNTPHPKKRSKYPLLALAVGVILIIGGGYYLFQGKKPQTPAPELANSKKVNLTLRETRSTLSPQIFTGKARTAYEIARTIPEVLDGLYCYCRCRENFGHKNLLSCYVDNHAAT